MTAVYHPLQVWGPVFPHQGSFVQGIFSPVTPSDEVGRISDIHHPEYGTSLRLRNTLECPAFVAGIRVLNAAWEIVVLQIGPVKGPFDAAAFNLDAVPGAPVGSRYPTPERPRFVDYPMGILEPEEDLLVRAVPFGYPSTPTDLNMLVFVTPVITPVEEST